MERPIVNANGTIRSAEKEFCVVSLLHNNESLQLPFTSSKFFKYGARHEGDLSKVLNPGMVVNVRYELHQPDNKPKIKAAWIGEEPGPISETVYNQNGRVIHVDVDHFLILDDNFVSTILAEKEVAFREGKVLKDFDSLKSGEMVKYDAVPCSDDATGAQYKATCVWFGLEPQFLDRFRTLVAATEENDCSEIENVIGTVSVIVNDAIALVDFESPKDRKAVLFRNRISANCATAVEVGDVLIMRVRLGYVLRLRCWFVVATEKVCTEIPGTVEEVCEDLSTRSRDVPLSNGVPFQKSWPTQNVSLVLRWPGICKMEGEKVKVNPEAHGILVIPAFELRADDRVVCALNRNKPLDEETLKRRGCNIYFDAAFVRSSKTFDNFRVVRMWFKESVRPSAQELLCSELKYTGSAGFERNVLYTGKIKSLPIYTCAIAVVNDIPVLVWIDSLVKDKEVYRPISTIDMFLNVGMNVSLTIQKGTNGRPHRAEKCWKAADDAAAARGKLVADNNLTCSWMNVWGRGTVFKEGFLSKENDNYFVVRSSEGLTESLDVQKDKFFVDGLLADEVQLEQHLGRIINYHVASESRKDDKGGWRVGEFIASAWIGEPPSPFVVLKDKLAVPKGLIDYSKIYFAVVDEFPLPTHVICKIGVIPVLVSVSDIKNDDKPITGTLGENLKRGDTVSMQIREKSLAEVTVLVTNGWVDLVKLSYDNTFIINVTGPVVKLPAPRGFIKVTGGSLEVPFDLSDVEDVKSMSADKNDIFSWFERVRNRIQLGTKVRFSAIMTGGTSEDPLEARACEVWLDDS